ncbi:MAG: hypothetical protein ISR57_09040, partial [Bacteroidales bacterium]|nr:hypothetical protein [Bacteroidales bacterium]
GVGNINGFSDGSGVVIAQQLFNPDAVPGSVLYTITPATTSCTGEDTTFTMWVKPLPHLTNLPKGDSICNNTGPNITLTSDVTNTWFTWTATGSSGNILGYADQTTPTTLLNQTLTNSGFVYEWATYQVSPASAGCDGPDSNYVVTVYPVPDLSNNPPDTAICNGQATGIVLSSNVTGTLFTWTATGSSLLVTGYSDQTTPTDTLDQILFNTGYDIETVTYTLTPNANGCDGIDTSFVVTVYPVPDVSNTPMLKEICNNNNTDIDLTSNVTGTLFTWTATGSSANITGYTDNTTPSTHIGDNLINLGDVNETVTYHITPHANGCDGVIVDYVVTVVPSPYLTNNPLKQNQCNNLNTNITLESNVAGTEFTWTCTASSGNISGYSNSTTPGTLIDQTLINSGFDIDSVIYHVTPQNSGCPGSVTDYSVVVYPVPDVYFVPNGETVCEGVTSNIQNQSHVLGATFSWIATASSPNLSGYSDDSGDLIAQTIDNTGFTIETVTYNVTPEANGCPPGLTQPVILTVNPRPAVINAVTSFSQCNNATTAIGLQADVTGSTFAWRAFASSGSLSGFSNGTGATIVQTLVNDGYNIDSVTYRVAATANSCPGDSTDFVVVVFPVADVIFTPSSQSLCSGETTGFTITSNVDSTSFTWTASGSSPDVSGYGSGSGDTIQQTLYNAGYLIPTVTYTVTPVANGCTGTSNNVVVEVYPLPVVSLILCFDTLMTLEYQPFELKGANPLGGVYSGTGVSNGQFFPAIADTGRHTITYYYVNTYGCDGMDSLHITIVDPVLHNCGDTMTDIRDNQTYPTVEIDNQCWMAVNLNFGNVIASAQMQRDNCLPEKYCINDNPANCNTYGGLYHWNEIMRYTESDGAQGFCPPGWHIPTEADWNTLFNFYISSGFAGSALKGSGYSGFNALLEGIRFHNTVWRFRTTDVVLNSTIYWSSTKHGPDKAWSHGINEVVFDIDYTPSVSFYPSQWTNAFLVRCIKD